jgi:hypothetical protein
MIISEKAKVRTPIEDMLLKEMTDEDTMDTVLESDYVDVLDDDSTDTGLFGNSSSEDDLEDLLGDDDDDLF